MDLFDELKAVVLKQSKEGEFPSWLQEEVMVIANNPEQYGDKVSLIGTLKTQILDFDSYAGVGCFNTSVSAEMIRSTIRKIQLNSDTGEKEVQE